LHKFRTVALMLVIGLGALACTDETETAPPGGSCIDYGSVDTNVCNGGACSFANDVVPLFRVSCSVGGSCHNSARPAAKEDLALGPSLADPDPVQADIDTIHARIVNGSANRSTLPLVVPTDPARSWLLAKMEYPDFSACPDASDSCKDSTDGCGRLMPETNLTPIEADRLAIVRAWISSGAPNN
jgi:hypothetical protein